MFRTLVDGRLSPDNIANRLNHALAEGNEQGMFVTMFIGLIDLKTGHMEFCNAGHNPPLLDGEYMKVEPNAPIGLWPELDFAGEEGCESGYYDLHRDLDDAFFIVYLRIKSRPSVEWSLHSSISPTSCHDQPGRS